MHNYFVLDHDTHQRHRKTLLLKKRKIKIQIIGDDVKQLNLLKRKKIFLFY